MRNIKLFSKITYLVTNRFAYKDKNVVKVFYIYKNIYNIVLPLDIKKVKAHGYSDETYYINEAKKIIDKMINNGSLNKYSEKYLKDKKKKSILLLAIPSICVCLALGISLGTYFALRSKAQEVNVEVPEINGLMFSNEKAYIGQDYDTNISVNTTLTTSLLPDTLNKVTSGNRTVQPTEYTYTVNDNKESGSLHIPGQYIEGDVKIELELVTPGPEYVNFDFTSETCNIKDKEGKDVTEVIKGETFEGKISLNQETTGIHLPSVLDITMGGVPVPLSDYEFNPYTGEISFIPTGNIKIEVEEEISGITLIYKYAQDHNSLTLAAAPEAGTFTVDWGDGGVESFNKAKKVTHTYDASTEEGTLRRVKISGITEDGISQVDANQLISIAYFNDFSSGVMVTPNSFNNPYLLEELYLSSKVFDIMPIEDAKNLHTIVIEDNNQWYNDFDSNIIAHPFGDEGDVELIQGCIRSVLPSDAGITEISDKAFYGSGIKEIHIPASVKRFVVNPFRYSKDLNKITVDPNSEYFTSRNQSGNECNMVAALTEGSGVQYPGNLVIGTNNTIIPDDGTVTTLAEGAFVGLSIKNINIPNCIQKIVTGSVYSCNQLESINFESVLDSNLTEYFFGGADFIRIDRFGQLGGSPLLNNLVIPPSVTGVAGANLLGNTNTSLTEMTVLPTVPPTVGSDGIFKDASQIPPNLLIYVPDNSVNAYKAAGGWSLAADIIKPLSERSTH